MLRRLLAFLLICTSAFPQLPIVTGDSSEQRNADFVVRINVNLVQVDAVVTDLKASE